MKTTRLQFNAKEFKDTRDIISAFFGAKFDLAEELDKARKNTDALAKVISEDESQLVRLAMGDTEGIIRDRATIMASLKTNRESYNALMAPYTAMVKKTDDAIAKAMALFNNKDSALYKAYVDYVVEPSDDKYDAYAKAMADRFVELGLKDATADNVAHYLTNADRELKGKTAVKKGDIRDALKPSAFASATLGKFYTNNKVAFSSAKFADYVRKCAKKATK